jgi:hypothetical protein
MRRGGVRAPVPLALSAGRGLPAAALGPGRGLPPAAGAAPYHSMTHSDHGVPAQHSHNNHSHHHHAAAAAAAAAASADSGSATHHSSDHAPGADGPADEKPHAAKAPPASVDGPRRGADGGGPGGERGGGGGGSARGRRGWAAAGYTGAILAGALLGWLTSKAKEEPEDEAGAGGGAAGKRRGPPLRSRVFGEGGDGGGELAERLRSAVERAEDVVYAAMGDIAHTFMSAVGAAAAAGSGAARGAPPLNSTRQQPHAWPACAARA